MKEIILVTKQNALIAHRKSPCRKGDFINHSLHSYLKFLQLLLINDWYSNWDWKMLWNENECGRN